MFTKLIGNENVKASLRQLISSGRVPNSLLFTGPEGVGKKHFAIELARAFVCQDPGENYGCGECSACTRVATFHTPTSEKGDDYDRVFFSDHPDVGLVIPYKRNLRVGAIRALEVQANFRPYEARARILIVDDADKMNDAASNALLKTLEEPPSTTYVILVTSRPNLLLSTIRSRCQTIRFAPVGSMTIETYLRTERAMSSDDARLAARVADGSIKKAAALNINTYRTRREILLAVVDQALIKRDRAVLIRASDGFNDAKNKDLFEDNIEILESLGHDLWLIAKGGSGSIKNIDLSDRLPSIVSGIAPEGLSNFLANIEELRQGLAVNINRRIATDALLIKETA